MTHFVTKAISAGCLTSRSSTFILSRTLFTGRADVPIIIRNASTAMHDAAPKVVEPKASCLEAKVSEAEMNLTATLMALTDTQTKLATATEKANNLQVGTAEHDLALKAVRETEVSVAKAEETVLKATAFAARADLRLAHVQFPSSARVTARELGYDRALDNLRKHRDIMSASSSVTSTPGQDKSDAHVKSVIMVGNLSFVMLLVVLLSGCLYVSSKVTSETDALAMLIRKREAYDYIQSTNQYDYIKYLKFVSLSNDTSMVSFTPFESIPDVKRTDESS